ncbi:MAG: hypothetical protein KAR39_04140 [Thermoplasmata archaeon]|nr:hypothetical protein [Thermoplasmata archaeon]
MEAIDWFENPAYRYDKRIRTVILVMLSLTPVIAIAIGFVWTGKSGPLYLLPIGFLLGLIPYIGRTFLHPQKVGTSKEGLCFQYRFNSSIKTYPWRNIRKIEYEKVRAYPLMPESCRIAGIYGTNRKMNRLGINLFCEVIELMRKEAKNHDVKIVQVVPDWGLIKGSDRIRENGSIDWQKIAFTKYEMAFAVVTGFAMFSVVAFLSPMRSSIRSQLFFMVVYLVYLLIIFLGIRSNKFVPRKYGMSREKLYLQYTKKLETYRWDEISHIYPEKTRGSTKLAIESIDGSVRLVGFLMKSERQRIVDYYGSQRELD